MKTLLCLILVCVAARAEITAEARLETYYLDPQPAEMPRLFRALSETGYFDRTENVPIAIGFFSALLARHPDQVDEWLLQLNGLSLKANRVLASALWQAGLPLGADLLRLMSEHSTYRGELERLANLPVMPLIDTSVQSLSSMRLQWGAFLATADERHIMQIVDALGLEHPALTAALRTSLAEKAAAHPKVRAILRSSEGGRWLRVEG